MSFGSSDGLIIVVQKMFFEAKLPYEHSANGQKSAKLFFSLPFKASESVCQPRTAHFTRAGICENITKCGRLFKTFYLILGSFALNHFNKMYHRALTHLPFLAYNHTEHNIRRRLRDSTTVTDKGTVGYCISVGFKS